MSKFEEAIKRIQSISMIIVIGSGLGLYILSKREAYFVWMAAEVVPMFGYPLLGLLLLGCIFGGYGVVLFVIDKYKDVKELLNDLKELKSKKNG